MVPTTNTTSSSAAASQVPHKWDATKIPSQRGQIAVITGANSGIGYVMARELARKGAHVVLACRSESKGQDAVQRLQAELADTTDAGQVEFMQLDVSSIDSVQAFASSFKAKHDRVNLLINNAGIMAVPYAETVDGYESQFATNHLGHFALTAQLFHLLKTGAPSRVVNISSSAHRSAKLNVDEIMTPEAKYSSMVDYCNSKLSNILFTLELARRLKQQNVQGVMSVVAHPGFTRTNLTGAPIQNSGWFVSTFWRVFTWLPLMQAAEMGALSPLYAATAEGVQSGEFFGPTNCNGAWGYPTLETPVNDSQSEEAATKLWAFSERLAKLRFTVE